MAENYVLLETIELTQSAASVTFDNIPQTGYTDLKIVMSARNDVTGTGGYARITFNGSTTGFSSRNLYGYGSSTGSFNSASWTFAYVPANGFTANTFSNTEFYIPNYTSSNQKSILIDSVAEDNSATSGPMNLGAGLWTGTAAITSVTLTTHNNSSDAAANFLAGSTFSLYGIAAVGTTPTVAPKATGGNIVANDGTYWYHAFLSSGTFTPQTALTADVLVIAGGGGATDNSSGGGGAGGLLLHSSQSLTATNYSCTVGAGGAGTGGAGLPAGKGTNSQFAFLTAAIGGGGSWGRNYSPNGNQDGGCGAGMVGGSGSPGIGSQGFNGGSGSNSAPNYGGGGGGGMGSVGGNGSSTAGGAGGNGLSTYSSWGLATSTGQNVSGTYWFAGGGGGGINANSSGSGAGGNGGGGAAVPSGTTPISGTAGTGGGGGASGYPVTGVAAGSGGSGIVIVRYAMV